MTMSPPRRALIVCFQRLGDVLLTTALIRSLRRAWPQARLDAAVFAHTASALEGNPDLDRVIAWPRAAGGLGALRGTASIFRQYDLAIATLATDRTHLTAWAAAPRRAGVVPPAGQSGARWKRWLSDAWVQTELHDTHVVTQYLNLAERIGVPRHAELVPPRSASQEPMERVRAGRKGVPYVVVHPVAMYRYKGWTRAGWLQLIRWLAQQGLDVVVDSGPAEAERGFVRELLADLSPAASGAVRMADALRFPELTPLLEQARVYIGPDTSVTHLAAAAGTATVALFGPMSPVTWGPWPRGFAEAVKSPWLMTAPWQQRGNVWLLQGIDHCVPCLREGCERHPDSRADCLDALPASRVIAAVDQALRRDPARSPAAPEV